MDDNFRISSGTLPLNTWTHVALARNSGTATLYINGVSQGTYAYSTSIAATPVLIGKYYNGTGYDFAGYISDVRVVKGSAVYTSNFTPPTAPLTAVSGTSLLCNMTNAGIPDSAMMNDLETVGNAQVSTSVKKFGTGSLSLATNTGSDYFSENQYQTFAFGTGDFTIETWIYPTSTTSYQCLVSVGSGDGTNTGEFSLYSRHAGANGMIIYYNSGGGNQALYTSNGIVPANNVWSHLAVVRYNGTVTFYLNGVAGTTGTIAGQLGGASVQTTIGVRTGNTSITYFPGYLDDFRVSKIARYTANFTPPTSAFYTF